MVFQGNNFPTDEDCEVTYGESRSTSCTVLPNGSVEAVFAGGIPTSQNGIEPILQFKKPENSVPPALSGLEPIAYIAATPSNKENILFPNPVNIDDNAAPENIASSYPGGAELILDVPGLAEKIAQGNAEILICDKVCKYIEAKSSPTQVACETPAIQTTKSNQLYQTEEEVNLCIDGFDSELHGKQYIGTLSDYAFDGETLPSIENSEAQCEIGITLSKGHVGVLSELRFFMSYFTPDLLIG